MKKVNTLIVVLSAMLFSCKTIQVNSKSRFSDGVKVTNLGYMLGYKPSSKKNANKEKSAQVNNILPETIVPEQKKEITVSIKNTEFIYPENATAEVGVKDFPEEDILLYALELKKFAVEKGYDTTYALVANMGQLSTTKRLYLIDLSTMQIINKALVSHGRGKGQSIYVKQYSNTPGSNCTSLGKYKIGKSYTGGYGYSYRIDGLEESNNKALSRNIVLHSMSCIPDTENYAPACVTEGCPAVSKKYLSSLQPVIESRKKPMLFWIFDSLLQQVAIDSPETESTGLVINKH